MAVSKHDFITSAFIIIQLIRLPVALAQSAPVPEECEALAVWESSREERIEQEFQRRGIADSAGKQLHRAEVEQVIDQRIQTLKELCEQKKKQTSSDKSKTIRNSTSPLGCAHAV